MQEPNRSRLRILYIGNYFPLTVMATLGKKLEAHYHLTYASDSPNKGIRLLKMCWAIWRERRTTDWVIIDTYSSLNFYYAWLSAQLCRFLHQDYITYLHGGNLPARLQRSPKMSQAIFAHSHSNVAPSGYLKAAFERNGFKSMLIPNFIHLENYQFIQREQLRPRLLWVRAFEHTYHPEMTIQVFAAIYKLYPDAQLCMIGPDKGSMEKCKLLAVELGIDQCVTFTGPLSKAEWIARSVDYDLFVSTTHFDNTPISIIEAMALGIPVISTNVGGMPHLIHDGEEGLLSPDNNVSAMVDNILRLLTSSEAALKIGRKARQKAETFGWEVVEKQWMHLLNRTEY